MSKFPLGSTNYANSLVSKYYILLSFETYTYVQMRKLGVSARGLYPVSLEFFPSLKSLLQGPTVTQLQSPGYGPATSQSHAQSRNPQNHTPARGVFALEMQANIKGVQLPLFWLSPRMQHQEK